jgi:hypothetical protein
VAARSAVRAKDRGRLAMTVPLPAVLAGIAPTVPERRGKAAIAGPAFQASDAASGALAAKAATPSAATASHAVNAPMKIPGSIAQTGPSAVTSARTTILMHARHAWT